MSQELSSGADRSQRLEQVLAEYLRAEEIGQPLDEERLVREHPDLADELVSFFRNRTAVQRVADEVKSHDLPTRDSQRALDFPGAGEMVRYFGDYELLEEIARGGMGVVYKARQISLNRVVALKMILSGQFASEQEVRRFRAEAEAAANLDHPGIVPIYEVGECDGRQYYSMAYIEGGSLGEWVGRLKADPKAAVELMIQVCRAAHFAHQHGILHRDLKPANILIDAQGRPHVADFGLAKRVGADSRMTMSGAVVGTPCYMAPEQARAEKVVTTAADVYTLGAVLYELLTGQPPFRAATPVEMLRQVLEAEPAAPRSLNRRIDRDLDTIVLKCLEKEPARRYESAAALGDDLARWQHGEPIVARPIGLAERTWKWVKRRPMAAALSGTAAALIVLIAAGGPLVWKREARLRQAAATHAQQAQAAQWIASEAEKERDAKQLEAHKSTVAANLRRAKAIRAGAEPGAPAEALKLLAESAALRRVMDDSASRLGGEAVEQTNSFWSSMLPQLNDEATQWLTQSTLLLERSFGMPAPESDGRAGGSIPGGARWTNLGPHPYAISPDGQWLVRPRKSARGISQALDLVRVETGTIAGTIDVTPVGDSRTAITPAFAADGHLLIASVGKDFKLHVERRAVPSGARADSVTIDLVAIFFPVPPEIKGRVYPERRLAEGLYKPAISFSTDRQRITIFQPGRFTPRLKSPGRPAAVFEVATGKLISKTTADAWFEPVAAMPTGDQLVGWRPKDPDHAVRDNAVLELLDIATGKVLHNREVKVPRLGRESDPYYRPLRSTVSPDGHWLATTAGNVVSLHEITGNKSMNSLLPGPRHEYFTGEDRVPPSLVTFSPDSRILAAVTTSAIHLLSVPDLKLLVTKSHGLNAGQDHGISSEVNEPVAASYLTDGRVCAGFSARSRNLLEPSIGSGTWQVWHALAAKVPMSPPYPGERSVTMAARFLPDKPIAYLASGGFLRAIDFSREEERIVIGSGGNERQLLPVELRLGGDGVEVHWGFEWHDFDSSGRWYLFRNQVWDVKERRQHRSLLEKGWLLARSADRRYVALRSMPAGEDQVGDNATAARGADSPSASAGTRRTSPVQVWDLEADREICRFDSQDWSAVDDFRFSPGGRYLVARRLEEEYEYKHEVVIGRVADGKTIGRAKGQYIGEVTYDRHHSLFDPSGTKLLLVDEQNDPEKGTIYVLQLVELETGQTIETIPYNVRPLGFGVSYDGGVGWVISAGGESLALVRQSEADREKSDLVFWTAKGGKQPPTTLDLVGPGRPNLAINRDGTRVVVAGAARESRPPRDPPQLLQVWDVSKQEVVATISRNRGELSSWLLLPASNAVAVSFREEYERYTVPVTEKDLKKRQREAEQQRRCELWDLANGTLRATFPGSYDLGQAAGGKYLVLSGYPKTKVVEGATGQISFEAEGRFWARTSEDNHSNAELSPDGSILILLSTTGLLLCRLEEKRQVAVPVRGNPVRQSEAPFYRGYARSDPQEFQWWFSPDSTLFITEDAKTGVLSFWDTRDGSLTRTLDPRGRHTLPDGQVGGNNLVQLGPDGKALAVRVNEQIRLFDLSSGERICVFPRRSHYGVVNAVAVSSDGRWVATDCGDRTVGLWHSASGQFAAMLDGYAGQVSAVEFSPDGKQLLTRDATGRLALWRIDAAADDARDVPEVTFIWQRQAAPPAKGRPALAVSPDGRRFAYGSADGTLCIARLDDGADQRTVSEGTSAVLSVAYRHDGQVLASGGADGLIRLWDANSGAKIREWSADQGEIRGLAFQPDTGLLATAGTDVRLWQTEPPQLLLHLHQPEKPLRDLCFSRDGRCVLTCGEDQTVRRFDLESHRQALRELNLGW